MEGLIRWGKPLERIRPYYPQGGEGRVPYPLEAVVRVHCVQLFYTSVIRLWKICSMRSRVCVA